jgi:hypothetical protein
MGVALNNESAALVILSIRGLPASKMSPRLEGPSAVTVARKGFSAIMIFTLVG